MSATLLYGPDGEPVPGLAEDPTIDISALTSAGLLPQDPGKEDPKNKRKYTCPKCQLNVWGKPGLGGRIQCIDCAVPFIDAKELVEVPPEAAESSD
jgi:hypothetical protein